MRIGDRQPALIHPGAEDARTARARHVDLTIALPRRRVGERLKRKVLDSVVTILCQDRRPVSRRRAGSGPDGKREGVWSQTH